MAGILTIFRNRIKNLSDPARCFKVRKNAEQLNLTGLCIFNVEGASSSRDISA
jgi:hypothetical protein